MKLFIRVAPLFAAASLFASLGDDADTCNDQYGEKYSSRDDVYHNQNEIVCYRKPPVGASVVYNRKLIAIEVAFFGKKFSDAEIVALLNANGKGWVKEKEKLGIAMLRDKPLGTWTTPDGRKAIYITTEGKDPTLTIQSPERLEQIAAHNRIGAK